MWRTGSIEALRWKGAQRVASEAKASVVSEVGHPTPEAPETKVPKYGL